MELERRVSALRTRSPRFGGGAATRGRETTLFVAAAQRPRSERTIELLKEYDVFAVPVERAEDARYARGARRGRRSVARLPAARRRPADLRRGGRLRGGAPRSGAPPRPRRKAFLSDLRDLKVGDFVVHVDHGIRACSSA